MQRKWKFSLFNYHKRYYVAKSFHRRTGTKRLFQLNLPYELPYRKCGKYGLSKSPPKSTLIITKGKKTTDSLNKNEFNTHMHIKWQRLMTQTIKSLVFHFRCFCDKDCDVRQRTMEIPLRCCWYLIFTIHGRHHTGNSIMQLSFIEYL